jgi:hypothetical protein
MPEAAAGRKRADHGPANSSSFNAAGRLNSGPRRIRAAESQSWPRLACASRQRALSGFFIDIILAFHLVDAAVLD